MSDARAADRLEAELGRAFASLAEELGVGANELRVRVAPFDAEARFAHEAEERLVARAVETRRRELATGRRLAHELLGEIGCARAPLLPGPRRAPAWPARVVGSISHARGIAAVAVGRRPPIRALGLDVEGAEDLRADLLDTVLTAGERARLASTRAALGARAKLAFCAKEAAYKAWSDELASIPEFTDVEIEFDPAGDGFTARLRACAASHSIARSLRGRCARVADLAYAAAIVVAT